MELPETIVCVDCGGVAHKLSYDRPDEPWEPGDIVAYRCADCGDRWDIELADDDEDGAGDGGGRFGGDSHGFSVGN